MGVCEGPGEVVIRGDSSNCALSLGTVIGCQGMFLACPTIPSRCVRDQQGLFGHTT